MNKALTLLLLLSLLWFAPHDTYAGGDTAGYSAFGMWDLNLDVGVIKPTADFWSSPNSRNVPFDVPFLLMIHGRQIHNITGVSIGISEISGDADLWASCAQAGDTGLCGCSCSEHPCMSRAKTTGGDTVVVTIPPLNPLKHYKFCIQIDGHPGAAKVANLKRVLDAQIQALLNTKIKEFNFEKELSEDGLADYFTNPLQDFLTDFFKNDKACEYVQDKCPCLDTKTPTCARNSCDTARGVCHLDPAALKAINWMDLRTRFLLDTNILNAIKAYKTTAQTIANKRADLAGIINARLRNQKPHYQMQKRVRYNAEYQILENASKVQHKSNDTAGLSVKVDTVMRNDQKLSYNTVNLDGQSREIFKYRVTSDGDLYFYSDASKSLKEDLDLFDKKYADSVPLYRKDFLRAVDSLDAVKRGKMYDFKMSDYNLDVLSQKLAKVLGTAGVDYTAYQRDKKALLDTRLGLELDTVRLYNEVELFKRAIRTLDTIPVLRDASDNTVLAAKNIFLGINFNNFVDSFVNSNPISLLAASNISISTTATFKTRADWYFVPDFGLAYVFDFKTSSKYNRINGHSPQNIVPYYGVQFHLSPINKQVPFSAFKRMNVGRTPGEKFLKYWEYAFSLNFGFSMLPIENQDNYKGAIGKFAFLGGAGFRLYDFLRVNTGAYVSGYKNGDPLVRDGFRTAVHPYVGVSLDLDIEKYITGIVDRVKARKLVSQ